MKKIFPKVYNDQLLICVGETEDEVEYIVGESILNADSEKEKNVWKKAIRVACLDDIEKVFQFVSETNFSEAFSLAQRINEVIQEYDKFWQQELYKLKNKINE